MTPFLTIVIIAMALVTLWIIWKMFVFFLQILFGANTGPRTTTTADSGDEIDGMNEGDLHSGPHGYSPNTAYPQTQYGSGFDDEADWAHEHED